MDNPFKKIFSSFGAGGQSVVGIDIGSSAIKVVQLRKRNGRAVLETYGALALGPFAGAEVGQSVKIASNQVVEALQSLLKESSVTTKQCGVAIPLSSSLVSLIEMPMLDPKQLPQMVPLEARKYIPVPITEVTLDWWVIPKAENSSSYMDVQEAEPSVDRNRAEQAKTAEILLVVIHNEALKSYQEVVKSSGLDASFYEIEVFSTIRGSLDRDPAPQMICDIGAGATKIYIVEEGIVRVSHTVNRGSQEITLALSRALEISVAEAEKLKRANGLNTQEGSQNDASQVGFTTLSYIFAEANRVMLSYQKKSRKNVRRVILSGGGSSLKNIQATAGEYLKTEIVLADPFSKVEAPAFLANLLKEAGPQFTVALGLALRRLQELP